MDSPIYTIIAGIVILTLSLFRYQIKRKQKEQKRAAERKKQAQLALEAEQERQRQRGEKVKPQYPTDRKTLPEPVRDTFAGGATPKQLLKWELEIDKIGRQMLGQLDSKMSALQTMLLEANRTVNRIEILLETLEQYKGAAGSSTAAENRRQERRQKFEFTELEEVPAAAREAKREVKTEEPQAVAVLREAEPEPAADVPDSSAVGSFSHSAGEKVSVGSHFDSLFSESNRSYRPVQPTLELKRQIETLADYGYEPRQIAQNLNISVGEVDLVLSLRE